MMNIENSEFRNEHGLHQHALLRLHESINQPIPNSTVLSDADKNALALKLLHGSVDSLVKSLSTRMKVLVPTKMTQKIPGVRRETLEFFLHDALTIQQRIIMKSNQKFSQKIYLMS